MYSAGCKEIRWNVNLSKVGFVRQAHFCMNCSGIWKQPKFTCRQVHFKLWQEKQLATIEYNLNPPIQLKWKIIIPITFKGILRHFESGGPFSFNLSMHAHCYTCVKRAKKEKQVIILVFRELHIKYIYLRRLSVWRITIDFLDSCTIEESALSYTLILKKMPCHIHSFIHSFF